MLADTIFARALTVLKGGFAEFFVGSPVFLYDAAFEDSNMAPVHDPLSLGNLYEVTSANLNAPNGAWSILPVSTRFPHGAVRMTLERTNETGAIALGVVLHTFPTDLKTFRIMATCSTPQGPHGPTDTWATVVRASETGDLDPGNRVKTIVQTLQSSWHERPLQMSHPCARMNTPLPPPLDGGGDWVSQDVFDMLFPGVTPSPATDPDAEPDVAPLVPEPVFTLQMDVDRTAGSGTASLYVKAVGAGFIVDPGPGYTVGHHERRTFVHPYMSPLSADGTSVNYIGAAGVNLTIIATGGDGPVSVTLEDFLIFGTRGPGLTGMVGELLSANFWPNGLKHAVGALRARLLDWAYAGVIRRPVTRNRGKAAEAPRTRKPRPK